MQKSINLGPQSIEGNAYNLKVALKVAFQILGQKILQNHPYTPKVF